LKRPAGVDRETGLRVEGRCPILIFDQFEEFITLFEEAVRVGDTKEAREAAQAQEKILRALVGLLQDKTLPVKILLVFREDYLAKLDVLFEHCPDLLDQYLRLRSPRVEDLKQIIRAPFEKKELRAQFLKSQSGGSGSEITEELAEKVAVELSKRSEGGRANLSELQIVCRKLWESTDPDKLFQAKGVQGLLEQYLADSLGAFPKDLRDPAVALLGHMITSASTRNIVSKDDLLEDEKANFSHERIERALAALTNSKLVTLEVRRNVYFYEIVSEFLVPWIKEQEAARLVLIKSRELEKEAAKKAEQDRLATELKLAHQQKRNILVASIAAFLILLTLLIGVGMFFRQRRLARVNLERVEAERLKAEQEAKISKRESENANLIADRLVKVTSRSAEDRLQALDDLDSLVNKKQMPVQIASAILLIAANDENDKVADEAMKIVQRVAKSDGELGKAINSAADDKTGLAQKLKNGLPARFYIKLANSEQEKRATQIKKALEQKGYVVAPFDVVGDGATNTNTLKYSSPSAAGDLSPDTLLALLRQADGPKWTKKEPLSSDQARPKNFEIWLAREIVKLEKLLVNFEDREGNIIEDVQFELFIKNLATNYISTAMLPTGGTYPLPPGKYSLTVRAQGYKTINRDFSITEGRDNQLDIRMLRR
jgi:hypothetical protein